ncbi:MAG: hypothetical protein QF440_03470 [Candidatus Thalassarchaeaceae archaeon]|nr:hypothetical protein [Candidatus Thalassarchaeaceae archaeon]
MARRDEPSNPFKKSSRPDNNPSKKRVVKRRDSAPAPPSRGSNSPPPPPGGGAKITPKTAPKPHSPSSRGPASAGKGVGLRKQSVKDDSPLSKKSDLKAKSLIKETVSRVSSTTPSTSGDTRPPKKTEPTNPFKKKPAQKQQKRPTGRPGKRNRPQSPSKKVRKLHRGKYQEFKYDVRKILDEEKVEDEHRSNVLGQAWAKGERQGVNEAKDFIVGKIEAGIISQKCGDRIINLIDSLTTRR